MSWPVCIEGDHWCTGPGTATGHAALNGLAEHCSGREGAVIILHYPGGHTYLLSVASITLILPHLHSQHVDTHRHRTLSCQLAHICDIGSFTAELNR